MESVRAWGRRGRRGEGGESVRSITHASTPSALDLVSHTEPRVTHVAGRRPAVDHVIQGLDCVQYVLLGVVALLLDRPIEFSHHAVQRRGDARLLCFVRERERFSFCFLLRRAALRLHRQKSGEVSDSRRAHFLYSRTFHMWLRKGLSTL